MTPTPRRDLLAVAAVVLAAVAFAGSFSHVRSVVAENGQDGWLSWAIAAMPEVSVLLSILKVRRARTTGEPTTWAWIVGGSAAAFTVAANLATATPTLWGYVVAVWPAWASIGAAGMLEFRPAGRASKKEQVHKTGRATEPDRERTAPPRPARPRTPGWTAQVGAAQVQDPEDQIPDREPVDVSDLVLVGRAVAADLARAGRPLTRAALIAGVRARGHGLSTDRAGALLRALRTAPDPAAGLAR